MLIDAHCDLLYQLWQHSYDINQSKQLQFDLTKWRNSPVRIQAFAIFVPDDVPEYKQYDVALKMVELFYEKIITPNPDIVQIKTKKDIEDLENHQRGAILTLEGCHPIGRDLNKLKQLLDYGVRIVGLTWNNNNAIADSIDHPHGKGLSSFGYEVIDLLNDEQIWTDVSHLSIKGFYDVISTAHGVMASHSNAFSVCPHRRNLDDQQIAALIKREGWIGVTFVPYFTKPNEPVQINDVMKHIDYFLECGARDHLGFGSDFDGISTTIQNLETVENYVNIIEALDKRYDKSTVKQITGANFIRKFPRLKE
ncbi:dipeptidase [Amphibacillus jilinensis]|uniref:dipeptidase n=1 Tax=Amphibacillus jilinensis TaxID=1216008 RepID=UPI0002DD1FB9|nr:dipeptidase [Amphibacillus jilinensis]